MSTVIDHTVRVLDQEIDTIEICSGSPDFLVVGTYSLLTRTGPSADAGDGAYEEEGKSNTSTRVGSLRILPIDANHSVATNDQYKTSLSRQDLPCAILDIRFCPTDGTLLGVSTSIGEIRLFRVVAFPGSEGTSSDPPQILPIGTIDLSGDCNEEHEASAPLITQFAWTMTTTRTLSKMVAPGEVTRHYLAACDTRGQTKIVMLEMPFSADRHIAQEQTKEHFSYRISSIHKHMYDLEAWTISTLELRMTESISEQIALSGGDDSCLILSKYSLNCHDVPVAKDEDTEGVEFVAPPIRVHIDKLTHSAGVVSIFPLATQHTATLPTVAATTIPVLTGSYDQRLRLLLLDVNTFRMTCVSELELDGGVWRISRLDRYSLHDSDGTSTKSHILLISAMHAGCYIVRLNESSDNGTRSGYWAWTVEAHFKEPHESMVYASTARRLDVTVDEHQVWQIISTSFYDKRICVWQWTDTAKHQSHEAELDDNRRSV